MLRKSLSGHHPLLLAFLVFTLPFAIDAQEAGKRPRLCVLTLDPGATPARRFAPFFQRLQDLGYVDGRTMTIDYRSAEGRNDRFPALAAECLRLNADIIVVTTTPAAQAAKNLTKTVPIVMIPLGDPVGTGLVASLARPGGNVTGQTFMASGLPAKRLALLKEAAPRISHVLVLTYLVDPIAAPQIQELEKAARSLGVKLTVHDVRTPSDFPPAFDAGIRKGADGLLTTAESIFAFQGERVVELAARYRLPALYPYRVVVDSGGLMAYDSYTPDLLGRTATYVDKILTKRREAGRPAHRATHEIRARHQPQSREGPRPHDLTVAALAGRSGDRMRGGDLYWVRDSLSMGPRNCPSTEASNSAVELTPGSRSLAAAAHRGRSATILGRGRNTSSVRPSLE
jgi:putative ABC transport system substrate-binding protein